jgi:SAM-dependent methyltransferase
MMDNRVFYRKNAQTFFERTAHLDVERLYARFLPLLSPGARILDAGCGSGRDTKAFVARGYAVTALDATPEMAALAEQFSGQKVRVLRFQEMDYTEAFDGIWACASLLHVPLAELPTVFERFIAALKPNGYWYMSFKAGDGEKQRGIRQFTDFNEDSLRAFVGGFEQLRLVTIGTSDDTRAAGNEQERWVSAIVQKVPSVPAQQL